MHSESRDDVKHAGVLLRGVLERLSARRHVVEQVFHRDLRPLHSGTWPRWSFQLPVLVARAVPVGLASCHGGHTQVRHEAHAGQRLTPEPHGADGLKVVIFAQLGCGMALAEKRQVLELRNEIVRRRQLSFTQPRQGDGGSVGLT